MSPEAVEAFGLRLVDLVTYVVVLVALVFVPLGALEVLAFGGLVFTKWITFLGGAGLGAYASLRLRPASPKRRAASVDAGMNNPTVGDVQAPRVQRLAAAMPPARWTELSVRERFAPNVKRFFGAVAIVGMSMALEFVFGVGLGT